MSRRRAQLLCLASALGIVSCAEKPLAPPIKVAAHSEKPAPEKPAAAPVQPGRVTRIPLGDFFQHQQSGSAQCQQGPDQAGFRQFIPVPHQRLISALCLFL